jgi:hypothetical protein
MRFYVAIVRWIGIIRWGYVRVQSTPPTLATIDSRAWVLAIGNKSNKLHKKGIFSHRSRTFLVRGHDEVLKNSDWTFDMALPGPTRWPRSKEWLILMSAHVANVPIGRLPAILEPSQSGHRGSTRAGKTRRACMPMHPAHSGKFTYYMY